MFCLFCLCNILDCLIEDSPLLGCRFFFGDMGASGLVDWYVRLCVVGFLLLSESTFFLYIEEKWRMCVGIGLVWLCLLLVG